MSLNYEILSGEHDLGCQSGDVKKDCVLLVNLVNLFIKGLERAAEMQKEALELAVRQDAETIEAYMKTLSLPLSSASVDLTKEAFGAYVKAQDAVVVQIMEHTVAMMAIANEYPASALDFAAKVTSFIQQSMGHAVTLQQKALNLVVEQVKVMTEHSVENWIATRRLFEEDE